MWRRKYIVFQLDVHTGMTLKQLATAIADTIPNERIIEVADNFQTGKFVSSSAYYNEDPWNEAIWQMVNRHLIDHQFMPVKTIITIMVNHFIDDYRQLYPRSPIGDLSYMVDDSEITKSYPMLISEILCMLQNRYKTPESINAILKEAS